MRVQLVLLMVICGLWVATAALAVSEPVAVSPGDPLKLVLIDGRCPTFSWGAVSGAGSYELVVYRLGGDGEEAQPVLRQRISGAALAWTPSLDRCLERGGRYAWSVRAARRATASEWSAPSLFQVSVGPSRLELEAALRVVRSYLDADGGVGPFGLAEAPARQGLDSKTEASASAPAEAGKEDTQLSVEGDVVASSFTGDGWALTRLNPASLSAGTAAIDISGTAATASDVACTDCIAGGDLATESVGSSEVVDHSLTAADVDSTSIQERVSGTCPAGHSIRLIDLRPGYLDVELRCL